MDLRPCGEADFDSIWEIVNDGARAYRGVIPADRLRDPYMSREELAHEIADGVTFVGVEAEGALVAVMGTQHVQDVSLIRHAYVRTAWQQHGLGGRMLAHLRAETERPVLIGTWANAVWAIRFYQRHGFIVVGHDEKVRLLRRYWKVPERQIETSVVLADARWRALDPVEAERT